MQVAPDELLRIIEEQKIDLAWWGHVAPFANDIDLTEAKARGTLVPVYDGSHYKISANANPLYRVLTPATHTLLEFVSEEWYAQMRQRGHREYFLLVTSLTRPTYFQEQLAAEGRPALPNSTHEKGLAFDLWVRWFRKHLPIAAIVLEWVLRREQQRGNLNMIWEPSVGVYHICVSPTFVARHGEAPRALQCAS